eukprot:4969133-Prymnesium_polylepis.2
MELLNSPVEGEESGGDGSSDCAQALKSRMAAAATQAIASGAVPPPPPPAALQLLSPAATKVKDLLAGLGGRYIVDEQPPDQIDLTLAGKVSFTGRHLLHKWTEDDHGWAHGVVTAHYHDKRRKLGDDYINLMVLYDGEAEPAQHSLEADDSSTSPDAEDYSWCFLKELPSASS